MASSGFSLIDLAVVAAVLLVLPATLGGRWRWWALAAAGAAGACLSAPGGWVSIGLALPWGLAVAAATTRALRAAGPVVLWTVPAVIGLVGCAYAVAAWAWFLASTAGATPFGIQEPIVELTAVHFSYLGGGAVPLAGAALARTAPGTALRQVGRLSVALTAGAPTLVAAGFVTEAAAPMVGGAVLLTIGVWATGALELRSAWRDRGPVLARLLLAVSGVAVVAPMVLAVAWSAGQHWDVPVLSIDDMVRTHGAGNALGFVGAGLVALRLERATSTGPVRCR